MTCVDWLQERQGGPLVLVGWSMGAAAVVEAAYLRRTLNAIAAVVTLAGQTSGTRNAKHLEVPLLALHGEDDQVLPTSCSRTLAKRAPLGSLRLLQHMTHRMEHALPHVVEFIDSHLPLRGKA